MVKARNLFVSSAGPVPLVPMSTHVLHAAIGAVVFVAMMAVAVLAVATDAAGVRSAEAAELEAVVQTTPSTDAEPVDMYTAMAAVAAQLAALPQPTTTQVRRPAPAPRPREVVSPDDPGVWDALAHCETRGNWATTSAPGYSGGLGFAHSTWRSMGGGEFAAIAADATREQQIVIAQRVLESSGWGAWPGCTRLMGLR